jgi:HK97 family phage prohead protease
MTAPQPVKGQRIELEFDSALTAAEVLEDGYIKGTASTPSTDLMGHKVLKGAFDKSIQRKGLNGKDGIKLLDHHKSDRPVGNIKKLETVGDALKIEAQFFSNVSYAQDLYEVSKQIGGLNFSVGFELEDFEFVEEKKSKDGEYLIIKQGNLIEVSVVTFPAQPDATMDFVKSHETLSELEKALAAEFCRSRSEVHKLVKFLRANQYLLVDKSEPSAETIVKPAAHPLDVQLLKACTDLASRANRALR